MKDHEIFMAALDLSPEDRAAYVKQACGEDKELFENVLHLLDLHERGGDFLEKPAARLLETQLLPAENKLIGTSIGPYKLREQIGEGGFGVVYVAEQTEPVCRKVALKVIKPGMDTKEVIARFDVERQALAMMDHPNVAQVFDAGTTESGHPYFVMELVHGVSITEYCDRRKLSVRERLELFVDVCRAVQHAHQKGVIHRDLKPSNVLVAEIDGLAVPKIIDFGIAKAMGQKLTEQTVYTQFLQVVGTPLYMSPEQAALGVVDLDTRSDVYALGVMFYELMTGHTPFDREAMKEAGIDEMRRIVREVEPPCPSRRASTLKGEKVSTLAECRGMTPRNYVASLRGELDWIVMRAMEKNRSRRYQSAGELADDVQRYLRHEPVEASPPSSLYRLRKFVRRHKPMLVSATLVAGALLLGTGIAAWQAVQATKAEQKAEDRLVEVKAQRNAAEQEAAKTEAVVNFLIEDLLGSAVPEETLGREVKVTEVLENAELKVERAFTDQPTVKATIQGALAKIYRKLGDYQKARKHIEQAVELSKKHLGQDHPDTLSSMHELSIILTKQGKLEEAQDCAERTSNKRSQILGKENERTLHSLLVLSNILEKQGKYQECYALRERILKIQRRILGDQHADTLGTMDSLANSLRNLGRYDEARLLFERALQLRRKVLGKNHPATLASMNNLALTLDEYGAWDKARDLHKQTWDMRRKVLGEEHPETLSSMNNLALILHHLGEYEPARKLQEQIFNIRYHALGMEHPDTLGAMINLALTYREQDRLEKACDHLEKALEISSRILGKAHPDSLLIMNNLALTLKRQGQLERASDLLEEARKISSRRLGEGHPQTLRVVTNLAAVRAKQGRAEQAFELYKQSLDTSRKNLSEDHRLVQIIQRNFRIFLNSTAWSLAASSEGDPASRERAVGLAKKAVQFLPESGNSHNTLGTAQYRTGEYEQAIESLQQSIELGNGGTSFDFFFLAMSHWQLGNKKQALYWYRKAVEWMAGNNSDDEELIRFKAEARQLIEPTGKPEPVPLTAPKPP